jgi:hypothetical protein
MPLMQPHAPGLPVGACRPPCPHLPVPGHGLGVRPRCCTTAAPHTAARRTHAPSLQVRAVAHRTVAGLLQSPSRPRARTLLGLFGACPPHLRPALVEGPLLGGGFAGAAGSHAGGGGPHADAR